MTLDHKYKIWRMRAFVGTWIAYAGFYLCRKTIAVAQPEFMKEFGWGSELVGIILTGYHIGYSLGQFVNGALCDKFGPRRVLAMGFGLTILMNVLFGFSASITLMGLFWSINGYAQACGWPSVIKGMSNWFSLKERGKVMAFWGPSYAVGDVIGTGLAAFVIGRVVTQTVINPAGESVTFSDWRWVFWVGAIALSGVASLALSTFRNKPQDVGLPDISKYHKIQSIDPECIPEKINLWENIKGVISQRSVLILGITYMGVKFIRYTFLFWAVTYLALERGMATNAAGYISTLYALIGLLGTITASYLSDKLFRSRRAPISVIMLLGLMASLFFFWKTPVSLIPVAIGLVGFMNYGPDFVISGVAVQDFSPKSGTGTTTGFVNGVGAIGQSLSGVVVGFVAARFGWGAVFYILMGIALACALLMATLWNKVGDN